MEAGKGYLADVSRMALYRPHCGHKKAIPLDKRAKMA
jgi:hypothetical protein